MKLKLGCCVDKSCTPTTCMNLPEGKTCADCRNYNRCHGLLGNRAKSQVCDFFPSRFAEVKP